MKRRTKTRIAVCALLATAMCAVCALCLSACATRTSLDTVRDVMSLMDEGVYGTASTSSETMGPDVRPSYTDSDSTGSVTVMVYMIGSDLESYSGAATRDLQEMVDADYNGNVNVVVETGGAQSWWLRADFDPYVKQLWCINEDGFRHVGTAGTGSMVSPDSVTDFIEWAADSYPADRYMLVFWDHGGGTLAGFGYDELHSRDDALSLSELRSSIAASGVKFDIIGFDACLMGTIETAYALEPVADYLIASEEVEPGTGWPYERFLTELNDDATISSVDLGTIIVDDYTRSNRYTGVTGATMSIVDLREIPQVYEALSDYLDSAAESIVDDNDLYSTMSNARSSARSFGDGEYDQVDIVDLVSRTDFDGADELIAAVKSCVKYRSNTYLSGANGLAMYFPYSELDAYEDVRDDLEDLGYDEPLEFYTYFLGVMASSPGTSQQGYFNYDSQSELDTGVDPDVEQMLQEEYEEEHADEEFEYGETLASQEGDLYLAETSEGYVLEMTDYDWEMMSQFFLVVVMAYNDGYVMLGCDDAYTVTDDDNILVRYDGEWLCLDQQIVPFYNYHYQEVDGCAYYSGYSPALLNGETYIYLELAWPLVDSDGYTVNGESFEAHVEGYTLMDDVATSGRGLRQLEPGDQIQFVFDYYDSEGNYDGMIPAGAVITVYDQDDLVIDYLETEYAQTLCWGTYVDVYGDYAFTETIIQ